VGGRGGHLPMPTQLQRRPGDHLSLKQKCHLQAEENLGQGVQAGEQQCATQPAAERTSQEARAQVKRYSLGNN